MLEHKCLILVSLDSLSEMLYYVGPNLFRVSPGSDDSCDLYTEAAEAATQQTNGRLAAKYFELADEVYAKAGVESE
ncbi:unnamed protein product [Hydatigera taeniaeformis]|uniref:BRO1 domain-containing protein n=1 Tax=Hydatigena taeniaeformis TaxID=6205 RepID=A0A0R3WR54_HYDTA|nr:unnamed protein product [Hydatigera taeniaeformis]